MLPLSFPRVDDRLVEAEVTRDEIIGGHRIVVPFALEPHARRHSQLNYVVRAHTATGYFAASDLLTRIDQQSDFATDTCICKEGVDPTAGARYLEDVTFQVVSERNEQWVTEKARRMHRRGVRRIFSVWVKTQRVCEWSPERGGWLPQKDNLRIEDPCLVTPLPVRALLDQQEADNAVVGALYAKGNPRLLSLLAEAEARGVAKGREHARTTSEP